MKELPLAVVISALIKDNKILLIKRIRGDYVGLLSLPGGKIEKNEHLSEAATREILEESGIKSEFKDHLGFVSEHLIENGNITQHFLLHVCELEPKTTEITKDEEGKLEWFDLDKIQDMKEQIIPSDFLMIENIIKNKKKGYYNCVLEKIGDNHILKKFE
jgi:ADP-ribose pyrophosphatase YjhB (NUDIX family)